jgi:hypothetical protein
MKIIVWGCSQEKGCSSYSRWYAKNRDEINARYREWYAENREKALEKNRKYREKNREREKQRNKQYRLENPEKVSAQRKKYLLVNKQQINEKQNQWRKENPEKSRAYDAVKYALKLGRISRLSWCQLCGKKAGRKKTEAHHGSYAKEYRLSVVWLCVEHHRQLHAWLEKNKCE